MIKKATSIHREYGTGRLCRSVTPSVGAGRIFIFLLWSALAGRCAGVGHTHIGLVYCIMGVWCPWAGRFGDRKVGILMGEPCSWRNG